MSQLDTTVTFTRGPWRLVDRPSRGLQIEWGGDADGEERPICHMRWTDGMRADVNARVAADARLIASAPTMFHELELAADTFRDFSNVLRVIGKDTMSAAAAIAERHIREQLIAIQKAEGAAERPCWPPRGHAK